MLTPQDIQKLKESFATKKDLKKLATKEDLKGFVTKTDLKNELLKYATKEDIVNFKDEVLHEILTLRQELSIVIGYREQIEDHEVRLVKVEKKLQIA